jgi:hypothetical protein
MPARTLAILIAMTLFAGAAAADDNAPFKTNPGDVAPDMRTPPYLPAPPPLEKSAPPTVFTPPAPPSNQYAPGLPPGPVTGYGAGGMQQAPGAPPNPPYH